MYRADQFHLNYKEVPVVRRRETSHPAFFVRDLSGYTPITQSLSGMASEDIGERYVESVVDTLFASRGGVRNPDEDSFMLADPGNGEPGGGSLRIVRFEPQLHDAISPEEAAEIGAAAIAVVDGLIAVEEADLRKNPNPIQAHSRVVSYHALPPEYVELYSAQ